MNEKKKDQEWVEHTMVQRGRLKWIIKRGQIKYIRCENVPIISKVLLERNNHGHTAIYEDT